MHSRKPTGIAITPASIAFSMSAIAAHPDPEPVFRTNQNTNAPARVATERFKRNPWKPRIVFTSSFVNWRTRKLSKADRSRPSRECSASGRLTKQSADQSALFYWNPPKYFVLKRIGKGARIACRAGPRSHPSSVITQCLLAYIPRTRSSPHNYKPADELQAKRSPDSKLSAKIDVASGLTKSPKAKGPTPTGVRARIDAGTPDTS